MRGLLLALAILVVIDGDTILVDGERVRIMGLDAPEIDCHCPRECRLAQEAKGALARLLAQPPVIERHGKDRYGRTLARVTAGGRDVADSLIARGLARPYHGGRRQPWC
jgi:micrococcal nuclease